jgi:hypothetical protein
VATKSKRVSMSKTKLVETGEELEVAAGSDLTTQLHQLAQLHDAGALTDQEFVEAKQRVLTGG